MQSKKENSTSMDQRLDQYLGSHLSPINFIQDYQNKRLPVTILFYKICNSFPLNKLGSMKGAQKHLLEQDLKILQDLLPAEDLAKILKQKNNYRPKVGQYAEFLLCSFLNTVVEHKDLEFAPIEMDIKQGWDFKYKNQMFDITTNLDKVPKPNINLIKIDLIKLLDADNLIIKNGLEYLYNLLKENNILMKNSEVEYSNLLVNKVREKYIEITQHKVKPRQPYKSKILVTENILEGKNFPITLPEQVAGISVAEFKQENLSLTSLDKEDLKFLEEYKSLPADKKQILRTIIQSYKK